MGTHSKSNREARKRKYADQFAKTASNKKKKLEKIKRRLEKRKNERIQNDI